MPDRGGFHEGSARFRPVLIGVQGSIKRLAPAHATRRCAAVAVEPRYREGTGSVSRLLAEGTARLVELGRFATNPAAPVGACRHGGLKTARPRGGGECGGVRSRPGARLALPRAMTRAYVSMRAGG